MNWSIWLFFRRSPLNIVHAGLDVLRAEIGDYLQKTSQLHSNELHVKSFSVIDVESPNHHQLEGIANENPQEGKQNEIKSLATDVLSRQMDSALFQYLDKLAASIVDLLEDICESSEAAINILNELLQYEHIDAGLTDTNFITNC